MLGKIYTSHYEHYNGKAVCSLSRAITDVGGHGENRIEGVCQRDNGGDGNRGC